MDEATYHAKDGARMGPMAGVPLTPGALVAAVLDAIPRFTLPNGGRLPRVRLERPERRHRAYFIRRRVETLFAAGVQADAIVAQILREYVQVGGFIHRAIPALDTESPKHLNLRDLAKQTDTTPPSVVDSLGAAYQKKRCERIHAICWRAAVIYFDDLWLTNDPSSPVLDEGVLGRVLDHRLHLVERLEPGWLRSFRYVAPGYFHTIGTPLVAGRDFTWSDIDDHRPVAVVSENLARELWRKPEAALGRRIRERASSPWREIVGVVGDVHDNGVHEPAPSIVYWPSLMDQFYGNPGLTVRRAVTFAIRTDRAGTEQLLDECAPRSRP